MEQGRRLCLTYDESELSQPQLIDEFDWEEWREGMESTRPPGPQAFRDQIVRKELLRS